MVIHPFGHVRRPRLTFTNILPRTGRITAVALGSALMALVLLAHRPWPWGWNGFLGMALVSVVAFVLTRFHVRHTLTNLSPAGTTERIIWFVALLSVSGVQLMLRCLGPQELLGLGFLLTAPLVAQAMLTSALIGPAISLFALTVVIFLLGVSRALPVDMLAASWLAGAVGAHAVNPLKRRGDLLRAISIQAAAQAAIACCITAVSVSKASLVFESAGWAAVAAVGATSIFWLAVAVLERLFNIVSDWSLLELCSPDYPLIRELCLRAPGTYAHSVMVGNLAENAAYAIGANPVLCRTMAYFHDIGKLTRPSFFIENQMGDNVHDQMSPTMSAMVIAAHVKDGIALARKHHLPQVIIDGITQHHGTSLISFFYNRALEQSPAQPGDTQFEEYFRYEGPKPCSREAAILCLADSVEAVSRSVGRGSEALESMIYRVIEDRRADGQLDESDLTFRDLRRIHESFMNSLCALRHERIVYSDGESYGAPSSASHLDFESIAISTPPDSYKNGS